MSQPLASIVISSYNRLPLFRRTLWAIANRPPNVPFEVIVVDDGSTEDVLGELNGYSSQFEWTFVKFNGAEFEEKTGLKKFLNNPCATNNIGWMHSRGEYIFQQGNEIIPWGNVYDHMLQAIPEGTKNWMVMSTTYDMPPQILDLLDNMGQNLLASYVEECQRWPLQSITYRSDVTNYISLAPKGLWDTLRGYDERYYGGISAEDSDFVRRARTLPGFEMVVSDAISLHQYHAGKTCYYNPPPSVITKEEWDKGVAINHKIYHSWDGKTNVPEEWIPGGIGIGEVYKNW